MTTALASLLSGRPVRSDVAMTGEVSLTGRVLPIGGVKQKLLAAHRAGITTVLIPQRNEPDLDDVPAEVLEKLDVHTLGDVREVLALALEPALEPQARRRRPPGWPPNGRPQRAGSAGSLSCRRRRDRSSPGTAPGASVAARDRAAAGKTSVAARSQM